MMEALRAWAEALMAWMAAPLWENSPLSGWMCLAATGSLLLALIVLFVILHRRKLRRKRASASGSTITIRPDASSLPPLSVANLQGMGKREEQQDAFRISPLSAWTDNGLLCTLCDGMGGMAQGGEIARLAVSAISSGFPVGDTEAFANVPAMLSALSEDVYNRYNGRGGTTLVLTYTLRDKLWFWCIGDSDLFLLRGNRLFSLNRRHEYRYDLMERAIWSKAGSMTEVLADPQGGALTAFIGSRNPACDHTQEPFTLQKGDALLLCSDGVSDTLSLSEITRALLLQPEDCCAELERLILEKDKPHQDNYSAIVLRFNHIQTDVLSNGGMTNEPKNDECESPIVP